MPAAMVQVERLVNSATFRTKPTDPMFCAQRAWDQAAETFRSHAIEAIYAALADKLVRGEVQTLTPEMNKAVSEFFFLWNLRFNAAMTPGEDVTLNMAAPERTLTKPQEEILERKGVMFIRENKLPFRFINGMSIMIETDRGMERMANAKWGIVRAAEGEFLVPDNTTGLSVVPVSPTICLADDAGDIALTLKDVGMVNRQLKDGARGFVFARDLAACPVISRTRC